MPPITGPCFERFVTVPSGAIFSMPYFRVTKTLSLLSTTMCCGSATDPGGRICAGTLIAKNIVVNNIKYFIAGFPLVDSSFHYLHGSIGVSVYLSVPVFVSEKVKRQDKH